MGLKKHLDQFPLRIRRAFASFDDWDGVCEIRLRKDRPLSLSHYKGNIFLDEKGRVTEIRRGLRCTKEELRTYVATFCGGSVYRYFDTLKEGFLVDEEGYRLGVCPDNHAITAFLPEGFDGVNLRIPREKNDAAEPLLDAFGSLPLASTLILSAPGEGKTTLLRALAVALSSGNRKTPPLRTLVVDAKRELFPASFLCRGGMCDVLSGYEKGEGIRIATQLFSPQVILCDEIGGKEEADAILEAANSGPIFFATAHGKSGDEARRRPFLRTLLQSGIFSYLAILSRIPGECYKSHIRLETI